MAKIPDHIRKLIESFGGEIIDGGEITLGHGDDIGEACPGCGSVHAKPAGTLPEAQAMTLKEALGLLTNPAELKVGDFVRYRKTLTSAYIKNHSELHIVMEVLDEPVPVHLSMSDTSDCAATRRLDVVIGTVARDGSVLRYWSDRRELELYPNADKLIKQHS